MDRRQMGEDCWTERERWRGVRQQADGGLEGLRWRAGAMGWTGEGSSAQQRRPRKSRARSCVCVCSHSTDIWYRAERMEVVVACFKPWGVRHHPGGGGAGCKYCLSKGSVSWSVWDLPGCPRSVFLTQMHTLIHPTTHSSPHTCLSLSILPHTHPSTLLP